MTPTPLHAPPTPADLSDYLGQVSDYLLQDAPIATQVKPAELIALERLNQALNTHNQTLLDSARYKDLDTSDLASEQRTARLNQLKTDLNTTLKTLDEHGEIECKSRKSYLSFDIGITALEQEAKLRINDRLLHADWLNAIERISLGLVARPGLYALTFAYQEARIEVAGAFVLTEENTPQAKRLTDAPLPAPSCYFCHHAAWSPLIHWRKSAAGCATPCTPPLCATHSSIACRSNTMN